MGNLLLAYVVSLRQGDRRRRGRRAGCRMIFGFRGHPVLPQPVKSRHFIGQRAERSHLHAAVVRNLRHLLVVFA